MAMRRARTWPPTRPYVRVGGSWAYVCLPGDLANRQIAGHSVGVRHDADPVPAAFAALRFPLDEIEVFHTDRGGEFTGERIERMLDVSGITRSLSGPGNPYDNAVVESTNRLVKKELIHRNVYTNVEQLRSDVNRYVWWYNHQRLHSTLGYLSPVEFHTTRKNPLETVQHTVANPHRPRPVHGTGDAWQSGVDERLVLEEVRMAPHALPPVMRRAGAPGSPSRGNGSARRARSRS